MGEKRKIKVWNWQCPYCKRRFEEHQLEEEGYVDHIKSMAVPQKVLWCPSCGGQELLDEC